jgi:hypothetical protein
LWSALASAETSWAISGTPFESGANAAAMDQLSRGREVRRSSADGTLSAEDQARIRAMGLRSDAAVVVLRRIPKNNAARQLARLRVLAHHVDGFTPSGACAQVRSEGDGVGLCLGSVDGPFGKIPARVPVSATLTETQQGAVRLAIHNHRALEVKPLFTWSSIVPTDRLKFAYELYPAGDAWLEYSIVAVEMSDHKGSASKISDALLKIDTWLTKDLAR